VSAQIVIGLQTIISRQTELAEDAAVITVGSIHGGVRNNIIPEEVLLEGTIRSLNKEMQQKIHDKIKLTASKIAESAGAVAEVEIIDESGMKLGVKTLTGLTLDYLAGKGKGRKK
jgi:metal-dependent amidase/aminoacylase/carboxypeptidase family protein